MSLELNHYVSPRRSSYVEVTYKPIWEWVGDWRSVQPVLRLLTQAAKRSRRRRGLHRRALALAMCIMMPYSSAVQVLGQQEGTSAMSTIYCFCADHKDGLPAAQRSHLSITCDDSIPDCGFTHFDFGGDEHCFLVFAVAESRKVAHERLLRFLDAQGWVPVPLPVDWTKAHMLASELYASIHAQHWIAGRCEDPAKLDLPEIRKEVSRKIDQNLKWNKKFERLKARIDEYEKTQDSELLAKIMNECAALHVLPEYPTEDA